MFFFCFNTPKAAALNAGCLVFEWQSSFEGFIASLASQWRHIKQSGLAE